MRKQFRIVRVPRVLRSSSDLTMRLCQLGEIVFIGLGLHDEQGISVRGLKEAQDADAAFIELYTNLLPDFSLKRLEQMIGKRLAVVSRRELEDKSGEVVLSAAKVGKTVLLVPGDPLVATTHVALRIEAAKRGIRSRVVHGASILSAVVGLSGLHNYKFGKTVTVPFPADNPSDTPYEVVLQNKRLGLHTLCLLDVKAEEKRFLSINEALKTLMETETAKRKGAVTGDSLVVGVARAGSDAPAVKAGYARDVINLDFGGPPQCIVFPGRLHFMEADALIFLAGAPEAVRGMIE